MQLRDLFDDFPLSGSEVVPMALQQLLRTELDVMNDWQRAEQLLLQARENLPGRHEASIALYKMYAYSNHFDQALALINEVICDCAKECGLSESWRDQSYDNYSWQDAKGPTRFFLYSMKAMGFVLLRKGQLQESLEVLKQLQRLDPADQVGGSVVQEVVERILDKEDELGFVA